MQNQSLGIALDWEKINQLGNWDRLSATPEAEAALKNTAALSASQIAIKNEIREIPLLERLERCIDMIGAMCAERRPPMMSIPVRATDEDEFIVATLKDAIATINNHWN